MLYEWSLFFSNRYFIFRSSNLLAFYPICPSILLPENGDTSSDPYILGESRNLRFENGGSMSP